jgi:DNA sulfur modification protein DndD
MLIDQIILNNFRVYHGTHALLLSVNPEKNVSIISGQNGFGKTSLLTSLVWGLYGKLIADVDERYRKEIYETGGYKKYAEKLMSLPALKEAFAKYEDLKKQKAETKNVLEIGRLKQDIDNLYSFSITLKFTQIFIPHLSCNEVSVKRTYNTKTNNETVEILIDGKTNELTKTIGQEIFINDFILPKEIAKFFFFDAEKITALAEVRNLEEKQYFSKAYNEVLGIKKYSDLKQNLENLQLRVRKKSANKGDLQKIEELQAQLTEVNSLLHFHNSELETYEQILNLKKAEFSNIQEQLVRVGSALSHDELQEFKRIRNHLKEEIAKAKSKFSDMLELAPFAILASKMQQIDEQLTLEERQQHIGLVNNLLQEKYQELKQAFALQKDLDQLIVETILTDNLLPHKGTEQKVLLDFNPAQRNQFAAVFDNLKNSYSKNFKTLVSDLKRLQSSYNITQKKVQDAELKLDDPVIKTVKARYEKLKLEITELEKSILDSRVNINIKEKEAAGISRQLSEHTKYIKIDLADRQKEKTAARLIKQLDNFIYQLKQKKKASLEKNLKKQLNLLMHKSDFVKEVEVKIEGDLIDIDLYDNNQQIINKDSLSKGEQQLYVTALLKALINESNIQFPVFIDSPLQKFDRLHAANIIKDFYPSVSSQVILFPLLEKELNEAEYQMLLPKVGKAYLIKQMAPYQSEFFDIWPKDLFSQYNQTQQVHV